MNTEQNKNPFLRKEYGTPFETIPFDEIKFEHYEEAMMEGMHREAEEISKIAENPETPTFQNTIVPVTDETLGKVTTVFFNLMSSCTNPQMEELAQKMSPLLTEHANKIMMNEKLFQRVHYVWEHSEDLNPEEKTLVEKTHDGFLNSGANLPQEKKEELARLRMEMSQLTLQFSQNELHDTNDFFMHLTTEDEVKGLPETALDAASAEAKNRGLEGWVITLKAPSYGPFMTYSERRDLRERIYNAMDTLCTHDNENNNLEIVRRIVNLRLQIAKLMGYETFADMILGRRMAENKDNVYDLLDKLLDAYKPIAEKEIEELRLMAAEIEGTDFKIMPWDFSFYSHKLKMKLHNLDAEMLRPYFPLEKVQQGVFGLATRLYGITFEKRTDIQVYHPDVCAYEVKDQDGSHLAIMYCDFHPRDSKQSGAWMTNYREQHWDLEKNCDVRPIVSVTMNFTKPTPEKPALLTLGEVETFLHEFGHSLHSIFSKVKFESLSGTNVFWDFVELPSQFMENYAIEPEFLRTFAFHYKTGEPLPQELIDRIRKSRNFMCGYSCTRQVSLALLDMAYYTLHEPLTEDIRTFEHRSWERALVMPQRAESCMTVRFGHIMSGGYAAGYYSYKWAEVLDADAFAAFQEEGIFNRDTANRFRREILSRGNTEHPMTLYKRFRGKEPTINALLKRNGIKE